MRAAFALVLTAAACSTAASSAVVTPEFAPANQTKCKVLKSQKEPLIVEWPSAARAKLEARVRQGIVPVHYDGCVMEILGECRAPGSYRYLPITPKQDRLSIRNNEELYAAIPVFAASFEAKLESAGQLNVQMSIVGRFESGSPVAAHQLIGDCARATHRECDDRGRVRVLGGRRGAGRWRRLRPGRRGRRQAKPYRA
jgi:hypothetical protein